MGFLVPVAFCLITNRHFEARNSSRVRLLILLRGSSLVCLKYWNWVIWTRAATGATLATMLKACGVCCRLMSREPMCLQPTAQKPSVILFLWRARLLILTLSGRVKAKPKERLIWGLAR